MEQGLETIRAITNFIFLEEIPIKADLIIVPGSSHPQLPRKAVQLYKKGYARKIVFTGGFNPKINKKESDYGTEIAMSLGVPEKDIYREGGSLNTKENAVKSSRIIKRQKLVYKKILLVCKPYHARRLKMTFAKFFPRSQLLLVPVTDRENITKNNWWREKKKANIVLGEVAKIGEFFPKGDLSLR